MDEELIDVYLVNTKLEEQQQTIVELLVKNEGGLIEAETGGGKTISILAFISTIK